jgi:hypothetical protein
MCLANGLDLQFTLILLTPLILGTIGYGVLPHIFWMFIIVLSAVLWLLVFFIIGFIKRT